MIGREESQGYPNMNLYFEYWCENVLKKLSKKLFYPSSRADIEMGTIGVFHVFIYPKSNSNKTIEKSELQSQKNTQ